MPGCAIDQRTCIGCHVCAVARKTMRGSGGALILAVAMLVWGLKRPGRFLCIFLIRVSSPICLDPKRHPATVAMRSEPVAVLLSAYQPKRFDGYSGLEASIGSRSPVDRRFSAIAEFRRRC